MLFILTGDIQIGKTRWLEGLLSRMREDGVTVYGVTAPGVWVETDDPAHASIGDDGVLREKTGIDNVLWPQGRTVTFARRRDLAQNVQPDSQSERARLAWSIDDTAIDQVNAHFEWVGRELAHPSGINGEPAGAEPSRFLVVDELGRLELLEKTGLTSAMKMLSNGPVPACPNALAVVRKQLAPVAVEYFEQLWDEVRLISPSDASQADVLQSVFAGR